MVIEGVLKAEGTEQDKIYFYGVGEGDGNWTGLNCLNKTYSYLAHVEICNNKYGIAGYFSITSSRIEPCAYGFALGRDSFANPFSGFLKDNEIVGGIRMYDSCEFNCCSFLCVNPTRISHSNFIECGELVVRFKRYNFEKTIFENNYWGEDGSIEIAQKGIKTNLSFIRDYYDDARITKAVLVGYSSEKIEGIG